MSGLSFFQPNPGPDAPCPLCGVPRPHSPRYPDCACADCVQMAVDESGRALRFDASVGVGFAAIYADTGEPRASDVCFINGIPCRAAEAYFGGIVVRPVAAKGAAPRA